MSAFAFESESSSIYMCNSLPCNNIGRMIVSWFCNFCRAIVKSNFEIQYSTSEDPSKSGTTSVNFIFAIVYSPESLWQNRKREHPIYPSSNNTKGHCLLQ
ncbi:hypothetical protein GJ496_001702 [Pomphorhynchus laevis]|nr:hypothetical protein GJ496_001702 [Pomphorhynchus laevis]